MESHRKMKNMTPIDEIKIISFSLTYFEHVLENTVVYCHVKSVCYSIHEETCLQQTILSIYCISYGLCGGIFISSDALNSGRIF